MKKPHSLLLIILVVLILLSAANTVQAVEIVKSIPLNIPPTMAYDSYKGAIWVTTYYSYVNEIGMHVTGPTNTVSAISDSNYKVLANVTVGQNPSGIAYDSALHEIYVTNQGLGTVSVISDMSNSVVATIDLNTNSSHGGISNIVYDSGKGEMFVSSYAYGGVLVISDKTKQVVATIPLGNDPYPTALTYDSGQGEIYVSYQGLPEKNPANFMSAISDTTNSVIATVPLDNSIPSPGAYDSATGEIYMPNPINSSLLIISDETHTVVGSIPLEHYPMGVAYDPVKRVLLVGTAFNATYIVSDRTKSVIETVSISSVFMLYDSGRNVIVDLGNASIQFVSDDSLPSVSPTSAVPEFSWLVIFPLVTFVSLLLYRRHRKPVSLSKKLSTNIIGELYSSLIFKAFKGELVSKTSLIQSHI
jgi:YVTN family beta-propeller protein